MGIYPNIYSVEPLNTITFYFIFITNIIMTVVTIMLSESFFLFFFIIVEFPLYTVWVI